LRDLYEVIASEKLLSDGSLKADLPAVEDAIRQLPDLPVLMRTLREIKRAAPK